MTEPGRWETYLTLGREAFQRGDPLQALEAFRAAVDEAEQFGPLDERLALSLNNLAAAHRALGQPDRAAELLKRALAILTETLGLAHPEVAVALGNLGAVCEAAGQRDQAEQFFRQAVQVTERAAASDDPDLAGRAHADLANFLVSSGKLEEAVRAQRGAVTARMQSLGLTHPQVGATLLALADYEEQAGLAEQARESRRRGLELLGQGREGARALLGLAAEWQKSGRLESAASCFSRAIEALEQELGPDHPELADALDGRAGCLAAMGDFRRAEELCRRAGELRLRVYGELDARVGVSRRNLGGLRLQLGRLEEGAADLAASLAPLREGLGRHHPLLLETLSELGDVLNELGRPAESASVLAELAEAHRLAAAATPALAQALTRAGLAAFSASNPEEAARFFTEALDFWRETPAAPPSSLVSSLYNLASALTATGSLERAEMLYREALEKSRAALGQEHPLTLRVVVNYAHLCREAGRDEEAEALLAGISGGGR